MDVRPDQAVRRRRGRARPVGDRLRTDLGANLLGLRLYGAKARCESLDDAELEVAPFVAHPDALSAWSVPFFLDVVSGIVITED